MSYRTPPQLAREFGVDPAKVLDWIHAGELAAVNLATSQGGRPRWRISPEAAEAFLARRSAIPPPPRKRRKRRRDSDVIEFYR